MIHEGLAEYLGDQIDELNYLTVNGGNVFIDHMPSEPDRIVALLTNTGPEADSKLPYDPVGFQVMVRCEEGSDWALRRWEDIYSELQGLRNVTLPDGTEVIFVIIEQASPFRLAPDGNGRTIYSSNYRGEVRNVTTYRS